jgi:Protein of unknown function (DUF2891)
MMRDELAPRILPVVLSNVTTHYPYHDTHLSTASDLPRDPAVVHPSFGNSFDWHSSVHSHWTAVQLIAHFKTHPCESAEALRQLECAVDRNLSAQRIAVETNYLKGHRTYERPYGWAWALILATCVPTVEPLGAWIAEATIPWMSALPEPVRHGVHSNTAFAAGLMHDAARALDLDVLRQTIEERAKAWFANDRGWAERWERSGHDFVSPGLAEADLMRRVLPRETFAAWWRAFLPDLTADARILAPVDVPDVADGQIVHLHGLNVSRAGALARLGVALGDGELLAAAKRLYTTSADRAIQGDYLATHWLATFAWDAAGSIDKASVALQ